MRMWACMPVRSGVRGACAVVWLTRGTRSTARDGAATDAQCLARLKGADTPVVMLDVLDDETLREAGRLVWEQRGEGVFSATSSGLQYALTSYWRSRGWIAEKTSLPKAGPVPVIAAVSGSCSPVMAGQIAWARPAMVVVSKAPAPVSPSIDEQKGQFNLPPIRFTQVYAPQHQALEQKPALIGQTTVDQALAAAQQSTEREMKRAGYPK